MKRKDYQKGCLLLFLIFLLSCWGEETTADLGGQPFKVLAFPEGEKILYAHKGQDTEPTNATTIRSMRPDGSQKADLFSPRNALGGDIRLAPDGKNMVINVFDFSGNVTIGNGHFQLVFNHIWLVEGTKGVQLTGLVEKNVQDAPEGWSKDGKSIFFIHAGNVGVESGSFSRTPFEVWAINIYGSNPHRIIKGLNASVSPDGNTLAIYRIRPLPSDERFGIAETILTNTDGSNVRLVREWAIFCEWAPDGFRLACFDPLAGKIIIIDSKGNLIKELASVAGPPGLSWSPDGLFLAYGEGVTKIWKIRVDGTGEPILLAGEDDLNHSPQ